MLSYNKGVRGKVAYNYSYVINNIIKHRVCTIIAIIVAPAVTLFPCVPNRAIVLMLVTVSDLRLEKAV